METFENSFVDAIKTRLKELDENAFAVEKSGGLPVDAIRSVIRDDSKRAIPRITRAKEICDLLGLEFYVGQPRTETNAARKRIMDEHGVDAIRKGIVDKAHARKLEEAKPAIDIHLAKHDLPATDSTEFSLVKLQNIQAGAGAGRVNGNPEPPSALAFNKTWLTQVGITPGQASLIYVAGDSMEPTLKDGSIVLIDHKQNKPAGKHIYAIREGDALMVKRVEKLDDKTLLLTSDNPSYTTRVLTGFDLDDVAIVGRVVWSGFTVGP